MEIKKKVIKPFNNRTKKKFHSKKNKMKDKEKTEKI